MFESERERYPGLAQRCSNDSRIIGALSGRGLLVVASHVIQLRGFESESENKMERDEYLMCIFNEQ